MLDGYGIYTSFKFVFYVKKAPSKLKSICIRKHTSYLVSVSCLMSYAMQENGSTTDLLLRTGDGPDEFDLVFSRGSIRQDTALYYA